MHWDTLPPSWRDLVISSLAGAISDAKKSEDYANEHGLTVPQLLAQGRKRELESVWCFVMDHPKLAAGR